MSLFNTFLFFLFLVIYMCGCGLMKILVKPTGKIEEYKNIDGLILPLKGYAVDYLNYYTLDEIKEIKAKFNKEVFVVINRMINNKDIDNLKEVLMKIEQLNITGIFFYDLAVLQLKKELNLKTDLVWNASHMTTNYKTCDYYYEKGVKYAYLSNEITLKEVLAIKEKSKITPMFTLVSYPVVATSFRHLVTNYNKYYGLDVNDSLEVLEKVSNEKYLLNESEFGTTFKYGKILNNCSALIKLREVAFPYVVLIEDMINHEVFLRVLDIIRSNGSISLINDLIGDNTGFLNKETIYKVKRDE